MNKLIILIISFLIVLGAFVYLQKGETNLNINATGKIIVFADQTNYNEFAKTVNNKDYVQLAPKYFESYKTHNSIIILGIKNSESEKILKKYIENFNRNATFSMIKKDLFSEKQKVLIYYSDTEEKLLSLIKANGKANSNDASFVAVVSRLGVPSKVGITGNVIGNVVCNQEFVTTDIIFQSSVIAPYLGGYWGEDFDINKYLRVQMYAPFASSTFKQSTIKEAVKEVKEYAKTVVDDFKTEVKNNLIKVTAVCDECGQETSVSLKPSDYSELDTAGWVDTIKQYGCDKCPGSSVSLSTETIDITKVTEDFVNEKISPEAALNGILGKQDDFYDSLPKNYHYVVYCPDYYIPKWVISILMPVFVDTNKETYEPEWGKTIDWSKIESYSQPISFNTASPLTDSASKVYTLTPSYIVYNKVDVTSYPRGIVNNYFFHFGSYNLSAPETKEVNGVVYNFDYWNIDGEPCCSGKNSISEFSFDYVRAIAYYKRNDNLPVEDNLVAEEEQQPAVVPEPKVETKTCSDTDGDDIWKKGTCTDSNIVDDYCDGDFGQYLYEYSCINYECKNTGVDCVEKNALCYKGKCVKKNADSDYDGFTDIDEYKAGTDPKDANSHPGGNTNDCDAKCKTSNYLSGRNVNSAMDCHSPELFNVYDSGSILCCCTPKTPTYTCKDSDGGKYPFVFGTCEDSKTNAGVIDSCIDSHNIKEYYCSDDGICDSYNAECGVSRVCLQGSCRSPNI